MVRASSLIASHTPFLPLNCAQTFLLVGSNLAVVPGVLVALRLGVAVGSAPAVVLTLNGAVSGLYHLCDLQVPPRISWDVPSPSSSGDAWLMLGWRGSVVLRREFRARSVARSLVDVSAFTSWGTGRRRGDTRQATEFRLLVPCPLF